MSSQDKYKEFFLNFVIFRMPAKIVKFEELIMASDKVVGAVGEVGYETTRDPEPGIVAKVTLWVSDSSINLGTSPVVKQIGEINFKEDGNICRCVDEQYDNLLAEALTG